MRKNGRTEFKREPDESLERDVAAFLNLAGGGEIIIGADVDGVAVGVADVEEERLIIIRETNMIRREDK
ncbi:MAG: ATP-binding protein, partial [Deltaproteobacteria bacterium]|nr:ATP-binding protein [Deltaproteobacteria bacterium]